MPSIETKYFGTMPYSDGIVYEFPHGLAAFEDEKRLLLLEAPDVNRQPDLGAEVLVLALLSLHGKAMPTANLMAPVALNLKTRGLQAIRRDSRYYSHQYPLGVQVRHSQLVEEAC